MQRFVCEITCRGRNAWFNASHSVNIRTRLHNDTGRMCMQTHTHTQTYADTKAHLIPWRILLRMFRDAMRHYRVKTAKRISSLSVFEHTHTNAHTRTLTDNHTHAYMCCSADT